MVGELGAARPNPGPGSQAERRREMAAAQEGSGSQDDEYPETVRGDRLHELGSNNNNPPKNGRGVPATTAGSLAGLTTRRGTPRVRRPYRPRRDIARFRLTDRDEWGMRYVADMWTLRFDQALDMFALWHYQQDLAEYERQLVAYQQRPAGTPPVVPILQAQAKGKVQSIINRWIKYGYAVTDQPHDGDPVWLTLTMKAMRELKLPYEVGFPPKEDLKESGHIFACNQVRFKLMKTKTYGNYVWWAERAIKANWQEGQAGVEYDQLPDAELYLDGIRQIGVEVELTRKSDKRYDQILINLTDQYPQVLYCVRGNYLYSVVERARARLSGERQGQIDIILL
jgi:hypothetical protein